jgi:hypothetical protein
MKRRATSNRLIAAALAALFALLALPALHDDAHHAVLSATAGEGLAMRAGDSGTPSPPTSACPLCLAASQARSVLAGAGGACADAPVPLSRNLPSQAHDHAPGPLALCVAGPRAPPAA